MTVYSDRIFGPDETWSRIEALLPRFGPCVSGHVRDRSASLLKVKKHLPLREGLLPFRGLIREEKNMSRVVMIGIEGEPGLWMADLDAHTLTAVDSKAAHDLCKDGEVATHCIDLAAFSQTAEPLSGGYMDK